MNQEPERVEGYELPVDLLLEEEAEDVASVSSREVDDVTKDMEAQWGRDLSVSENLEHISDRIPNPDYSERVDLSKLSAAPAAEGGFQLPEINPGTGDEPHAATELRDEFKKIGAVIGEQLIKAFTQPNPLSGRNLKKLFPNPKAILDFVSSSVRGGRYTVAELAEYARRGGDSLTASRIEDAGRELGFT